MYPIHADARFRESSLLMSVKINEQNEPTKGNTLCADCLSIPPTLLLRRKITRTWWQRRTSKKKKKQRWELVDVTFTEGPGVKEIVNPYDKRGISSSHSTMHEEKPSLKQMFTSSRGPVCVFTQVCCAHASTVRGEHARICFYFFFLSCYSSITFFFLLLLPRGAKTHLFSPRCNLSHRDKTSLKRAHDLINCTSSVCSTE